MSLCGDVDAAGIRMPLHRFAGTIRRNKHRDDRAMVDYKIHWLKMMSVPESRAVVGRHDEINGRDNHHAAEIASKGRMNWQKRHGYGLRALGKTALARVKRINGGRLTARTFQSQQNEIAIQIDALNRSIRAAKPNTIRIR